MRTRRITPEGAVKASIRDFVNRVVGNHRLRLWAIVGGPLQAPGIADYLGVFEGRALAVECKAPGGKQSPAQAKFQEQWERAGGIYVLAYGPEDLAKALGLEGLFIW